jgi:DNA (cytosine-5)-methyltransferase 1
VNYLSVCSGVEAATVAWHPLGWKPLAFSEIEKFPSEVLAHHYPATPNLGDMTKYKEWNFGTDRLDLLVGGTPCQSFSVAGLRKGLDDPRGNLALVYCGILDKFRPKWFVWENVPGVLSSGGGRDFGSFLGAVAELGYGFSYRVLNAENWGVAQRRKRVFVVGHLARWEPTAKVLFESESLSGNTEKSKKQKQNITPATPNSIGALCARDYKGVGNQYVQEGKCIVENIYIPSVANCIQTTCNDYSRADGFNMIATGAFGKDIADTVTAKFSKGAELLQQGAQNGGNCVLQPIPIHDQATRFSGTNNGKGNGLGIGVSGDPMPTLDTSSRHATFHNMAVRRLTPVECERLQGFPDNYTNIKDKCPDGPRYKAMGNSMAVPVMQWIGKRIQMVEDGLL